MLPCLFKMPTWPNEELDGQQQGWVALAERVDKQKEKKRDPEIRKIMKQTKGRRRTLEVSHSATLPVID